MDAVDAGSRRLRLEAIERVLVRHLGGDQASGASKHLGVLQKLALRLRANWNVAFLAAFGP